MDAQTVAALVGSLGFPIAMCFMLCYFVYKIMTEQTEVIRKNTEAVNALVAKLDVIETIQRELDKKEEV